MGRGGGYSGSSRQKPSPSAPREAGTERGARTSLTCSLAAVPAQALPAVLRVGSGTVAALHSQPTGSGCHWASFPLLVRLTPGKQA